MMTDIHVWQNPIDLPGERAARFISADGGQMAWAARPEDRRGASLLFDGLAATGVDWQHNLPRRLEVDRDSAHLQARLTVAGTHTLIVMNAHYLARAGRDVAIRFADTLNATLVFGYEDGLGTTMHRTGLLDDASKNGWTCHPEYEPPFDIHVTNPAVPPLPDSEQERFPAVITNVDFGHFRGWNRALLSADEFAALDSVYCDVYHQTLALAERTPESVAALAKCLLPRPTRPASVTAVRAMQAGLFRRGVLWRVNLDTVYAWLDSSESRQPTERDYWRLRELWNPETAAVAVLTAVGYDTATMRKARLVDASTVTGPSGQHIPLTPYAATPLRVVEHLNNGPLVTSPPRSLAAQQKFLNEQFGFPLILPRSGRGRRRETLHPDNINLTYIRES